MKKLTKNFSSSISRGINKTKYIIIQYCYTEPEKMNAAFRSHLLQSFASSARHQSAPPVALIPWVSGARGGTGGGGGEEVPASKRKKHGKKGSNSNSNHRRHNNNYHLPTASSHITHASLSSIDSAAANSSSTKSGSWKTRDELRSRTRDELRSMGFQNQHKYHLQSMRSLSSITENEHFSDKSANAIKEQERRNFSSHTQSEDDEKATSVGKTQQHAQKEDYPPPTQLAKDFQTLLQTRRTASYFHPEPSLFSTEQENRTFWNAALDRALQCAQTVPNHKRTEPFFFQRMIAPSPATERLADIAYHVMYRKKKSVSLAEKKRDKWRAIPAFLVAIVQSKDHDLYPSVDEFSTTSRDGNGDDEKRLYQPLPFASVTTPRELEDVSSQFIHDAQNEIHVESKIDIYFTCIGGRNLRHSPWNECSDVMRTVCGSIRRRLECVAESPQ